MTRSTPRRAMLVVVAGSLLALPLLTGATVGAHAATPASRWVVSAHRVPWSPNGKVQVVRTAGQRTYLGGDFTRMVKSGTGTSFQRYRVAALSRTTGALVRAFHARVNGTVKALAVFDHKLFIGGEFTRVNGVTRDHLAALRLSDGRLAGSPRLAVDGPVFSLLHMRHRLYVAGDFQRAGGAARTHLFAMTGAGTVVNGWPKVPSGTDGTPYALAASADRNSVIVGGAFTQLAGRARAFLGQITRQGDVTPWAPVPQCDLNCFVLDATVSSTSAYAAIAGPGGHVAAYRLSDGGERWSVKANGDVQAVALDRRRLLVGGHFTRMNGVRQGLFAEVGARTGAVLDRRVRWSGPAWPGVVDIDLHDGVALLGGGFATINGQHRLAGITP